MSIQVSPEVNAMIFILTGERLMDADEDLAYESRMALLRPGPEAGPAVLADRQVGPRHR